MILPRLRKPTFLAMVPLIVVLVIALAYGQQAHKAWPDAFPRQGVGGVPASVDKLTMAVDSWGTSELNP